MIQILERDIISNISGEKYTDLVEQVYLNSD